MYKLSVQNAAGDTLQLTQNKNYAVTGVQGLTPVAAAINTSTAGMFDGVVYNSARLNYRNIIITLHFTHDVEKNRIKLYDYFQTKQFCTLHFSTDSRDVHISGYVETFECDLFSVSETAQISIICPNPYFQSVSEIVNSATTENNSIIIPNSGDVSAGMDIVINFTGAVTNPVIENTVTGEYFRLNSDFVSGDVVSINTRNGEKSVKLTRSDVNSNIINILGAGTSWLQLQHGNNTFRFNADSGADFMAVAFKHTDLFAGV